jgi:hypothetical protein
MYSNYNYPGFETPAFPHPYPYPFHEPDTPVKPKEKIKKHPKKPTGTTYQDYNKLIC